MVTTKITVLGCNAMQFGRNLLLFWRIVQPPSSE